MELWVWVTFCAAGFQTLRFMLQKKLATATLSAGGATFARFVFSAPIVLLLLPLYTQVSGHHLPALPMPFWTYAAVGGLTQILATVCVVVLFGRRNFAIGITFKKTEVILTAIVGLIVLGEGITVHALIAILIGLVGVLVLSETPNATGGLLRRIANPSAGMGLLSGLFFAVSGVTYRAASLELASDDAFFRAMITLAAVVTMQTVALGLWLCLREPGQVAKVLAAHRSAKWVGVTSMAGSFCWFTAFTLQNAAYVNAVGQVELAFSLLVTVLVFHERPQKRELLGIALLSISVLVLVLLT